MKSLFAKILLLSCLLSSSCVDHDFPLATYDCSGQAEISYNEDIRSLVTAKCATSGCHNGDLGEERNWLITERFIAKSAGVRDRITRRPGSDGHMPAKGSLTYEEILSIVCWVEQGAKNN